MIYAGIIMILVGFGNSLLAVHAFLFTNNALEKVQTSGNAIVFLQMGMLLTFDKLNDVPNWYAGMLILMSIGVLYLNVESMSDWLNSRRNRADDRIIPPPFKE